jgi:hypothetical protein
MRGKPVSRAARQCARNTVRLPFARTVLVIEIKPSLAQSNHLGMFGQRRELLHRCVVLARGFVRVNPDRAPDIGIAFGDRANGRKFGDLRADGQQRRDPCPARACENLRAFIRRRVIEMAMAVDKHHGVPAAST